MKAGKSVLHSDARVPSARREQPAAINFGTPDLRHYSNRSPGRRCYVLSSGVFRYALILPGIRQRSVEEQQIEPNFYSGKPQSERTVSIDKPLAALVAE